MNRTALKLVENVKSILIIRFEKRHKKKHFWNVEIKRSYNRMADVFRLLSELILYH